MLGLSTVHGRQGRTVCACLLSSQSTGAGAFTGTGTTASGMTITGTSTGCGCNRAIQHSHMTFIGISCNHELVCGVVARRVAVPNNVPDVVSDTLGHVAVDDGPCPPLLAFTGILLEWPMGTIHPLARLYGSHCGVGVSGHPDGREVRTPF